MEDILVAIVDDEPTYVHVINRVLQRNGFRTTVWSPGSDPIEFIQREQPQLVVLDMNLANKSGGNVLEVMRSEPGMKDVFVLLCSGADWLLQEQVQRWGTDHLLTLEKPFDLLEFMRNIQQLVARVTPSSELHSVPNS